MKSFMNILAIGVLVCFATPAPAENPYPIRPVRVIVPLPPGGGNDLTARAIASRLGAMTAQQFIVDNRAGGGGAVGAEIAAKAQPDGYTLILGGVASHGINPNLHLKNNYDPIKDFAPISLIATVPLVMVVHPSVPAKSIKELVEFAKAKPGALNYASLGEGSSTHLATVLFIMMSGAQMTHIPYNTTAPTTDLLGGQVQVMLSSIVRMQPLVKSGKLRALGVTGARRSPTMPDIPTVNEAGVPGYVTGSWYGILAPAKTPSTIVSMLNSNIVKIVRLSEVQSQMASDGADPVGSSPEEFAAHIKAELQRWKKVIAQAGVKVD